MGHRFDVLLSSSKFSFYYSFVFEIDIYLIVLTVLLDYHVDLNKLNVHCKLQNLHLNCVHFHPNMYEHNNHLFHASISPLSC